MRFRLDFCTVHCGRTVTAVQCSECFVRLQCRFQSWCRSLFGTRPALFNFKKYATRETPKFCSPLFMVNMKEGREGREVAGSRFTKGARGGSQKRKRNNCNIYRTRFSFPSPKLCLSWNLKHLQSYNTCQHCYTFAK